MSQVYVRHRSLSQKTFFMKATEVYAEAARIAHDEKIVPKSYRFTFGVPMCELCLSMIQNIERGDACFPNTSWGVIERKKYMALVPAVVPTLIANNYANVKGRGTHFAIKTLKAQLARHYRKHGSDGYILLVDLSNYFGSLDHARAIDLLDCFDDERLKALGAHFVNRQGEVGLGLGDEPNQMHAVAYLSPVDHFVTECCNVEAYGRYMDDLYAIHTSKDHLQVVLGCIETLCAARGLRLNTRKTKIVKLTRGFTFLKKRFKYTDTGKIVVRPSRKAITDERRRLKAHAALVRQGLMTLEQANQSYQSWRGSMRHLDAQKTVESMDALYRELFDPVNTCRGGLTEITLPLAA